MNTKEVGALKSLSKTDLEAWLDDAEANFGPLIKIDCAENGTVATLNRDAASPATKAVIIPDPTGAAPCPGGKTLVCRGRAYISGVCVKVLVCR
jgi:hypothetical protein